MKLNRTQRLIKSKKEAVSNLTKQWRESNQDHGKTIPNPDYSLDPDSFWQLTDDQQQLLVNYCKVMLKPSKRKLQPTYEIKHNFESTFLGGRFYVSNGAMNAALVIAGWVPLMGMSEYWNALHYQLDFCRPTGQHLNVSYEDPDALNIINWRDEKDNELKRNGHAGE